MNYSYRMLCTKSIYTYFEKHSSNGNNLFFWCALLSYKKNFLFRVQFHSLAFFFTFYFGKLWAHRIACLTSCNATFSTPKEIFQLYAMFFWLCTYNDKSVEHFNKFPVNVLGINYFMCYVFRSKYSVFLFIWQVGFGIYFIFA